MKKTAMILCLSVFAVLAILGAGTFLLYENLKDLESQRTSIILAAKKSLGRDIHYDKAVFSLWTGPAFSFTGVDIRERDGSASFASIERLSLKVAILPLFKKELVVKDVELFRPRFSLRRAASGQWNVADLLVSNEESSVRIRGLSVREGAVGVTDRAAGVVVALKDVEFKLQGLERGRKTDLDLKGTLVQPGTKDGRVEAVGTLSRPLRGRPWTETNVDMHLLTRGIDVERYRTYYGSYVPFKALKASLEMDAKVRGRWQQFTSSGKIGLSDVHLSYPAAFSSILSPGRVNLNYDLSRNGADVSLKDAELSIDDFRVKGSLKVQGLGTEDPRIETRATTNPFALEKLRPYIPFPILPQNVAAYIRDHIRSGLFRLEEGTLSGQLSQIRNMEKGDNASVLQVRIGVEKGVLSYGDSVPLFRDVRGKLVLQGKDFLLKGMTGSFGESPMALDGAIRNYCLDLPSTYPFAMKMTAGVKETVWLLGTDRMQKTRISGSSEVKLTGDGTLDNYTLTGDCNLTPLAYAYGAMSKPVGRANRLRATANIQQGEVLIPSMQYDLAPISLAGSGRFRFRGRQSLAVAIRSNTFDLKELATLGGDVAKYRPGGRFRFQLAGESRPQAWKELNWRGEAALEGVTIQPAADMKVLTQVSGTVYLSDQTVWTKGLSGRIGKSSLQLRGRMANPDNPAGEVSVSSDRLDLADLGLRSSKGPVRLEGLRGRVSIGKNAIVVRGLMARLNASVLNLDVSWPRASLEIPVGFALKASVLDQDDLLLLAGLEKEAPQTEGKGDKRSFRGDISALRGKIGGLPYRNLRRVLPIGNRGWRSVPSILTPWRASFPRRGRSGWPTGAIPPMRLPSASPASLPRRCCN